MTIRSKFPYIFTSIAIYLFSVLGVFLDKDYIYRWPLLFLSIIAILPILFAYLNFKKLPGQTLETIRSFKHDYYSITLLILIILSRFVLIDSYPFNSIGDELRDGGNVVNSIINGQIKDIFGFGSYNGFGYITQITLIPFQLLFSNDTLAFKIPAAIISCLDLLVIYKIIIKLINKKVAFYATLIIASLPIHMYYGRTEYLVMTSSLFSSLIFFLTYNLVKNFNGKNLVLLALISGFSLGFQPSIRIVLIISGIFVLYALIKKYIKQRSQLISYSLLYIGAVLTAFGPRILYANQDTLLQTDKMTIDSVQIFIDNYLKSLGVIGLSPTGSHFYLRAPLLNIFYFILFILGLLVVLKLKDRAIKLLIILGLLLIPLVNSAITNGINSDHRLTVFFVYLATTIAYGCEYIFSLIKNMTILDYPVYLALLLVVFFNIYQFFNNEYASYSMFLDTRDLNYQNYLNTYIGKIIKLNPVLNSSASLCVSGNYKEIDHKQRAHIDENLLYLTNYKYIDYKVNYSLPERTIAVSTNCDINLDIEVAKEYSFCQIYNKFVCPSDKLPLKIYVY